MFLNEFETEVERIFKGDEFLITLNEVTHEFNLYFEDNRFPHGFRGRNEKLRNDDLCVTFVM